MADRVGSIKLNDNPASKVNITLHQGGEYNVGVGDYLNRRHSNCGELCILSVSGKRN